jgi:hypothetical protein
MRSQNHTFVPAHLALYTRGVPLPGCGRPLVGGLFSLLFKHKEGSLEHNGPSHAAAVCLTRRCPGSFDVVTLLAGRELMLAAHGRVERTYSCKSVPHWQTCPSTRSKSCKLESAGRPFLDKPGPCDCRSLSSPRHHMTSARSRPYLVLLFFFGFFGPAISTAAGTRAANIASSAVLLKREAAELHARYLAGARNFA